MITFSQLSKMGRLGNQLWQLGTALSLGLKTDDFVHFPDWQYKKDFNVPEEYFSDTKIQVSRTYTEPHFHYAPIPHTPKRGECLDLVGYFQSPNYIDERVIPMLTPKMVFEKEEGLCAIHCRRGDYVRQPENHPTQGMDYYEKAMELTECKKFLVFGDDPKWNREHFIGNQFHFSEGKSEVEDLALMISRCESVIAANSSFSWWGGFLNQSSNKIVVVPGKWFGLNLPHSTKDLFPENWIRV